MWVWLNIYRNDKYGECDADVFFEEAEAKKALKRQIKGLKEDGIEYHYDKVYKEVWWLNGDDVESLRMQQKKVW